MGISYNVVWLFYSLAQRKLEGENQKLVYWNPALVKSCNCRCSCNFCLSIYFIRNAAIYLFSVLEIFVEFVIRWLKPTAKDIFICESLPNFIRLRRWQIEKRCHFEGGTTEKSFSIARDFSSFFVEMTIIHGIVCCSLLMKCENSSLAELLWIMDTKYL